MPNWKTEKLKKLARAFLSLRTEDEVLSFLRDVASLEELRELSNRWQVVLELNNGKNYRAIAAEVGLSTATITRIAHWLYEGEGGYKLALKRYKK